MITKGIVEDIVDEYRVRVRMPFIDSVKDTQQATPTELLSIATICTLPNEHPNLHIGDIVFIGFEDYDIGKPIILGLLFKSTASESYIDLIIRNLTVNSNCSLPWNTSIGEITPNELKSLSGIESNIQAQIDDLYSKIENIRGD